MSEVADSVIAESETVERELSARLYESEEAYEERILFNSLRGLPVGLWRDIFQLALPFIHYNGLKLQVPSRNHVPMSVAQTCGHWRQVALGARQLWTTINVVVQKSSDGQIEIHPQAQLIEQWLQLSAPLPLSISVQSQGFTRHSRKPTNGHVPIPLEDLLLTRLFLELPRWKNARLSISDISYDRLERYLMTVQKETPVLETLELHTDYNMPLTYTGSRNEESYGDMVARRCMPSQLWANSPRLRQLAIDHMTPFNPEYDQDFVSYWATATSHIPFHQLTVLKLNGDGDETLSIVELLQVLQSSPNLATFEVSQVEICDDPLYVPMFTMSHLRNLRLDVCSYHAENVEESEDLVSLTTILSHFRAPALTRLYLGYDEHLDVESFGRFIENSGCSLQELDLDRCVFRPEETVALLRLFPALRSLRHIIAECFEPMKLYELAVWDNEKSQFYLCPLLEKLIIDTTPLQPPFITSESDVSPGTLFVDMIRMRLSHGGQLTAKPCLKTLSLFARRYENLPATQVFSDFAADFAALKQLRSPPFNFNLLLPTDNYLL